MTTASPVRPYSGQREPQTRDVPHDNAAERAVVAACLAVPEKMLEVLPLDGADFYLENFGLLFAALVALHAARKQINVISLAAELKARGRLEQVGGAAALGELFNGGAMQAGHAASYAAIVRGHATRRRLITAGGLIAGLGYEEGQEPAALLAEGEALLFGARPQEAARDVTLATVMADLFGRLDRHETNAGLSTGLPLLDLIISGWRAGDLTLLAGRPSHGKSSLALEFALAAAQNGKAVQFFSLEMSEEDIAMRALARLAGVDMQRIRTDTLDDAQFGRIVTAHDASMQMAGRIHLDTSGTQTIDGLRAAMRLGKHRYDPALVIVDYLGLIEGVRKGRGDSLSTEIGSITRALKHEAKALHVPVIALSQLNRDIEGRADHEPQLSDLRDSGSLEQDADIVMFLQRPELYATSDDKREALAGRATVYVKKQRNGPLGTINLAWHGEHTAFEEVA